MMAMPSKRNALTRFQCWSSSYERSWLQRRFFAPAQRAVLEAMEHYLAMQPHAVLDVGCGTGRLLRSIHERWPDADLMGIDPTPGMVERARRLTTAAAFEVGFAEALPVSDASVDVVVSTFSFHHWSDRAAGLREVVRALKPDGCFFLADVLVPERFLRFLPWSHFQSSAQTQALFKQAGLHVLHQQSSVSGYVLISVGKKE